MRWSVAEYTIREYGGGILPRYGPWCVSWSKVSVACPNTQGCPGMWTNHSTLYPFLELEAGSVPPSLNFSQLDFVKPSSGFHLVTWERVNMAMRCYLLLWWCFNEKNDGNLLPSPFSLVVLKFNLVVFRCLEGSGHNQRSVCYKCNSGWDATLPFVHCSSGSKAYKCNNFLPN